MLDREPDDMLLLPPRARLLHIGPMKTGTTSIQAAANARRPKLLEHGVRYPGRWFNHARQLGALMGWSVDTQARSGPLRPDLLDTATTGVPKPQVWEDLQAEMDADHDRRIFITHEFVSQTDDPTAKRIVDRIGDRIHVCLTLRAPGRILPSLWAQGIRDDAQTEPYTDWLQRFYGKDVEHPISQRFQRMYDQAELVERWSRLVGPENVTIVIVDAADPDRLTDSFEAMLGLPAGMLAWGRTNRALTAPEVELFRAVNAGLQEHGGDWRSYFDLVRKGAILLGAQRRTPAPDEPRVRLPTWAARIAEEDGQAFAERIGKSQVRVIGDLDELAAPVPAADWPEISDVPIGIAAPSISAAVLAAQKQRKSSERRIADLERAASEHACPGFAERARRLPADRRAEQIAANFSTREVAAALKRRLLYKLRTRRSYPTNGRKVAPR